MSSIHPKILLAGGGTLGSVSPLLAIAKKYQADYLFVCSQTGPEKNIIAENNIAYVTLDSGKWRRYFSWQNFVDVFKLKINFWRALKIIHNFRPDLVLTAGSYVAVPVVWAAWVCRVPIIVHQQDIKVGLANRLMALFAKKITVVFPEQENNFSRKKVVVTGNPVRDFIKHDYDKPIVVITGGGLGARSLNDFIKPFIPKLLSQYEVHHILGSQNWDQRLELAGYQPYKFVTSGMLDLLSQADIIISRAGMSLISEAANLRKALILVPIPSSHQEFNASFLAKRNAAFMVKQGSYQIMERYLDKLLERPELRQGLADNLYNLFPQNASNDYVILINSILEKNASQSRQNQ